MLSSSSESEALSAPATTLRSLGLLSAAERESVAEIVALVANSQKQGCIYFGVANNRLKIEAAETLLAEELRVHRISTERLVLAERQDQDRQSSYAIKIADPAGFLASHIPEKPTLLLIHGLSELIRAEAAEDALGPPAGSAAQRLNYNRETFRKHALLSLFWIDPETMRYLAAKARDFWLFRSGTAQFLDAETESNIRPQDGSGWQTTQPSARWMGDVDEKLRQLAAYRAMDPPPLPRIASLLLDIGQLRFQHHELQAALECSMRRKDSFSRSGAGRERVVRKLGSRAPTAFWAIWT